MKENNHHIKPKKKKKNLPANAGDMGSVSGLERFRMQPMCQNYRVHMPELLKPQTL